MKKVLLSLASCLVLSTGAFATDMRGSLDLGLGNTALENSNGLTAFMNISGEKNILTKDLYIGAGISVDGFDSKLKEKDELGGVITDIYGKISYDIIKEVTLSALCGYSVGEVGNLYFDGTTYGAEAKYSINKTYSVGVNYKYSDLTTTNDFDFKAERIGAFVSFKL